MKYLLIICAITFTLLFLMHTDTAHPSEQLTNRRSKQCLLHQPIHSSGRSLLYRGIILLTRSSPPNVASAVSIGGSGGIASSSSGEYPVSVQELVMNGFELQKVLCAYDLIGDNLTCYPFCYLRHHLECKRGIL